LTSPLPSVGPIKMLQGNSESSSLNNLNWCHPHFVDTRVDEHGQSVKLNVTDNGSGFDPSSTKSNRGMMLMQSRAKSIGGQLKIDSRPGGSTQMTLAWPEWGIFCECSALVWRFLRGFGLTAQKVWHLRSRNRLGKNTLRARLSQTHYQ